MLKKLVAPLDPAPQYWLTLERLQRLEADLGNAVALLSMSGLLNQALDYWLRLELTQELLASSYWPEDQRKQELDTLEENWRCKYDPADWGLSDQQLRDKLLVAPCCRHWARMQWQQRLEKLYLERKQQLDQASCRLLRLSDKHLALELYHRIRAEEDSFESLALEYGEGPERFKGGLLKLQPLAQMPLGLGTLLNRMEPGELLTPQRLGNGFALVQLELFEPAPLNPATEETLLAQELQAWLQQLVLCLRAHLTSSDAALTLNS
ncbi:MAG: hypothetical protein CMQ19_00305 [Gammaproteobacteria bacterium]|nr:hypothetical protein [Gammaproteobacteria bacterium]|tara:strand:- start:95 stop:889 length:795 start_codon:yes stop_codon:yes gene_type:complete